MGKKSVLHFSITITIKAKTQKLNYNGEGGAIFRLWEDPGEQNNLISDSSLQWVKTEAYEWMNKEFQGSRLPVHGSNYHRHSNFYHRHSNFYPNNPIYE